MTAAHGSGLHRLRRIEGPDGPVLRREWHPAAAGLLGADFRTEVAAQRLAAAQGLAPPVLDHDPDAGWVSMPWMEGQPLEPDWPQRPARCAAVSGLLARLRSVSAPGLPPLDLAARVSLLHRRLAQRDAVAAARFDAELATALPQWQRTTTVSSTEAACAPCLVHGDLTPGNVLVRPDGSLLLLDWEYAHAGGAWDDLAAMMAGEPRVPAAWASAVPLAERGRFDAMLRLRRLLDALWHALRAGIPRGA